MYKHFIILALFCTYFKYIQGILLEKLPAVPNLRSSCFRYTFEFKLLSMKNTDYYISKFCYIVRF